MAAIAEQIQKLTIQDDNIAVAKPQNIEHIKNPILQEVEIAASETDSMETASVKSHDEFAGFHSSSDSELDVFFKLASGVSGPQHLSHDLYDPNWNPRTAVPPCHG